MSAITSLVDSVCNSFGQFLTAIPIIGPIFADVVASFCSVLTSILDANMG